MKNKIKVLIVLCASLLMILVCTGCGETEMTEIQVTPGTIQEAISNIEPGTRVILGEGEYAPVEIGSECSGTEKAPVAFVAAVGEKVVFKGLASEQGESDKPTIHLVNVSNFTLEGVEIIGGTHGILYESTPEQGNTVLENITIKSCTVHGVLGVHGIAAYAENDLAPVKNLRMDGCEVYDCLCDSSESTVFNGNIDGFSICNNVIHDNNNIGIDMIGFEGTAEHTEGDFDNAFDVDYVRNGICHDNVVYNISAEGNPAYLEDGEYDLCADGIYVDGGQDIDIYNNFVFSCNIGIEVATEHSPDDNELFKVSDINVYDNVVGDCQGWCGLCFGGYDADLGFTENCEFHNNTFVDNGTQIGVQRSSGNKIYDNLFIDGDSAVEFNGDCRQKDMFNEFGANTWCIGGDENILDWCDAGDYDIEKFFTEEVLGQQTIVTDRAQAIDGFASLIEGVGSSFVPDDALAELYASVVSEK